MSTKKIKEALERLFATARIGQGDLELVAAAQQELKAIRKACVALDANDVGGFVYNIRDRELLGWDGPRVKAWGKASQVITAIAKESK